MERVEASLDAASSAETSRADEPEAKDEEKVGPREAGRCSCGVLIITQIK